jgi:DNA-binding transcriptional LysR family regulator
VAAEALRSGRVLRVLEEHAASPLPVHAVTPSGRHLAAKVRALIDALVLGLRERV